MAWTKGFIPQNEIKVKITSATVEFAEEFGKYLGTTDKDSYPKVEKMSSTQLRKFFGEVKRQQLNGYKDSDFILLKPKLAYAVGRDKGKTKISDFYKVLSQAIDLVTNQEEFNRFISIFESIIAYHKATEEKCNIN